MDTTLELDDSLPFDLNADPTGNFIDAQKIEFECDVVDESKSSMEDQKPDLLIDQLNRMRSENKKLSEMLVIVCENYNALQGHLMDLMQKYSGDVVSLSRKRKFNTENSVCTLGNDDGNYGSICDQGYPKRVKEIRTDISRVTVKTDPTDTSLGVKDGYHWRKYGQKVTKDNPSPRAYFKCSFAPNCQVKKKVQRSVEDPSILVATYEGEHNHQRPLQAELLVASAHGSAAAASSPPESNCGEFSGPARTPDFIDHGLCNNNIQRSFPAIEQLMVEKMASSLTRNPNFTAALVAAISGRILSHDPDKKRIQTLRASGEM